MTGFDPTEHFLKLKGKDYLPVAWRLVWFREEHPDWAIHTGIVEHDAEVGRVVFRADITGDGIVHATGHKQESRKRFPDYLEKAETGAIGRALAALGYGTQFAPDLDEGEDVVDSPQSMGRSGSAVVGVPIPQTGGSTPPPVHFTPTDLREVEDNADIIRSADDPLWQRWLKVLAEAQGLGVRVQEIRLPMNRSDLKAYGAEVVQQTKQRKETLNTQAGAPA